MSPADLAGDLKAAFMLLTRLPVAGLPPRGRAPDLARSLWAYPVVGAAVGALAGIAYGISSVCGLPPSVAALTAVAASLAVTGAFHEDGLADTADGIGGGQTREHKLEIMRDSRIGTYGTVALVVALGLRAAAIAAIADPGLALWALASLGALSRAVIAAAVYAMAPARPDGMGVVAQDPPSTSVLAALAVGTAAAFAWGFGLGLALLGAAMLALLIGGRFGHRHLGGYTGDLLGAMQQIAEIFGLLVLAAALRTV